MPSYSITFWKTVYDSSGHEHRALQWVNRVKAATADDAMNRAKKDFCAFNRIPVWEFRADCIEVNEATRRLARTAQR